jgi:hypothetical protein
MSSPRRPAEHAQPGPSPRGHAWQVRGAGGSTLSQLSTSGDANGPNMPAQTSSDPSAGRRRVFGLTAWGAGPVAVCRLSRWMLPWLSVLFVSIVATYAVSRALANGPPVASGYPRSVPCRQINVRGGQHLRIGLARLWIRFRPVCHARMDMPKRPDTTTRPDLSPLSSADLFA